MRNVQNICTNTAPKCSDREKLKAVELENYRSKEGDEKVVEYRRKKLKQGGERTTNLLIQVRGECEWRWGERE